MPTVNLTILPAKLLESIPFKADFKRFILNIPKSDDIEFKRQHEHYSV